MMRGAILIRMRADHDEGMEGSRSDEGIEGPRWDQALEKRNQLLDGLVGELKQTISQRDEELTSSLDQLFRYPILSPPVLQYPILLA